MKAKSKVIKKFTPQDLKVEIKSDVEVVQVMEPPKRKAGVMVSSVDELVDKLKNEACVIWFTCFYPISSLLGPAKYVVYNKFIICLRDRMNGF